MLMICVTAIGLQVLVTSALRIGDLTDTSTHLHLLADIWILTYLIG